MRRYTQNVRVKAAITAITLAFTFFRLYIGADATLNCGGILLHLLYPFLHANIFHLAVNLIVLWSIRNKMEWIKASLISFVASYLPMYVSEPTVGLSGFLFAVFGLMWGKANRLYDATKTAAPIIIVSMLLPHVNGLLHLYAFALGYLMNNLILRSFGSVSRQSYQRKNHKP